MTLGSSWIQLPLGWIASVTFRIIVPRPGIEPRVMAMKASSPNHWTTRELPIPSCIKTPISWIPCLHFCWLTSFWWTHTSVVSRDGHFLQLCMFQKDLNSVLMFVDVWARYNSNNFHLEFWSPQCSTVLIMLCRNKIIVKIHHFLFVICCLSLKILRKCSELSLSTSQC